ncbi:hypothetical protein [Arcanobacterium pinnipediorum]|uniref:Uncharacterized protein n=1 Tax=Arcanobacterium pinnipediorum TaxID=1503041 RepID=A0ABY5AHJ7_9ACTO|nr:hypothetical protein [Arcanobacterium pinnipediorum]USR79332.1 hypothetical protein NG665_08150 [Arcanobacterium pinnipediorum]
MRIWTLEHPTFGRFEIIEAPAVEMRRIDPEWDAPPESETDIKPETDTSTVSNSGAETTTNPQAQTTSDSEINEQNLRLKNLAHRFERWANRLPRVLAPMKQRFFEYTDRIRSNVGNQVAVQLNGHTIARLGHPRCGSLGLRAIFAGEDDSSETSQSKDSIQPEDTNPTKDNDPTKGTNSAKDTNPTENITISYPEPGEFTNVSLASKPKIVIESSPFGDIISAYYLGTNQPLGANQPLNSNQPDTNQPDTNQPDTIQPDTIQPDTTHQSPNPTSHTTITPTTDGIFEFTAPQNSYAEKRQLMLEASPIKRFFLPILIGLGKVGWGWFLFLAVPFFEALFHPIWDAVKSYVSWIFSPIVWLWTSFWWLIGKILSPVWWLIKKIWWPIDWLFDKLGAFLSPVWDSITHFFKWLASFLPTLPDLPDWLAWLVDHPKLWIPLVTGVIFGIVAIIRHQRVRRYRNKNSDSQ